MNKSCQWTHGKREPKFLFSRQHPYKIAVRGFLRFAKERGEPVELNGKLITSFLSTFKGSTANLYKTGLRTWFMAQAKDSDERIRILDFFKGIKKITPTVGAARRDYVTIEELQTITSAMTERLAVMVLAYFYTGCRCSELIDIKVNDCTELNDGTAQIKINGKGRRERVVSLPGQIFTKARRIYKGNVFLFETAKGRKYSRAQVNNEIVRQSTRTRRIHTHSLRHSCAMHLTERGVSIERVSKYLGHSTPSTTAHYYLHGDIPTAREMGFHDAGAVLVAIQQGREKRKKERSPWRRRPSARVLPEGVESRVDGRSRFGQIPTKKGASE